MAKYYRVKKDTFIWKAGAILVENIGTGYVAIEDIWDATPVVGTEYISSRIVESPDNASFFERVYRDTIGGAIYRTKDELVALYDKAFK